MAANHIRPRGHRPKDESITSSDRTMISDRLWVAGFIVLRVAALDEHESSHSAEAAQDFGYARRNISEIRSSRPDNISVKDNSTVGSKVARLSGWNAPFG
ncbi:hypothetical protein QCM80_38695 [Bradyrhizobium sp. SSUT112]|uniref:hypothetical protein n=1 Tax=Bradyrhizobium sp. SSUT112 TaxID=3040604 RepID=UPI002448514C|nr:hypothetical protein [Bradyrhizobium sp. SSUT112]MDH2356520.1 hypothetical protein [Bradyrhizobium sp. SSUT112]